jgi:catechol 1,2-dioxygenase
VPDAGSAPDAGPPRDAGPTLQCHETEDNILGPFYRANAPMRQTLGDISQGSRLVLRGSVRGTDCDDLTGVLLDFWQADAAGVYDTTSPAFAWRGRQLSQACGPHVRCGYEVETILPGRYLNGPDYRPRHIHLKASHPGYVPLTTQIYFQGDPFLTSDPFVRSSLVVPLEQDLGGKELWATFDIVLQKI